MGCSTRGRCRAWEPLGEPVEQWLKHWCFDVGIHCLCDEHPTWAVWRFMGSWRSLAAHGGPSAAEKMGVQIHCESSDEWCRSRAALELHFRGMNLISAVQLNTRCTLMCKRSQNLSHFTAYLCLFQQFQLIKVVFREQSTNTMFSARSRYNERARK